MAVLISLFEIQELCAHRRQKAPAGCLAESTRTPWSTFPWRSLWPEKPASSCGTTSPSRPECAASGTIRGERAPVYRGKSIQQILSHNGTDVSYGSRRFTVFGAESGSSTILYFIDDTYYKETTQEYSESRPAVALILFDNREELARDATDEQEAQITAQVDNALQKWVAKTSGFLRKISGGRYLMIVQERNIRSFVENKFEILDEIRASSSTNAAAPPFPSASAGGGSLKECEAWARKALDMALGRGGDQAAVKQGDLRLLRRRVQGRGKSGIRSVPASSRPRCPTRFA